MFIILLLSERRLRPELEFISYQYSSCMHYSVFHQLMDSSLVVLKNTTYMLYPGFGVLGKVSLGLCN